MASQRLLAFSGRCPIKQATAATQRAAHQAAYLQQWRQLAPATDTQAYIEGQARLVLCWLAGQALLLAVGLLWAGRPHSLSLEPTPVHHVATWHALHD